MEAQSARLSATAAPLAGRASLHSSKAAQSPLAYDARLLLPAISSSPRGASTSLARLRERRKDGAQTEREGTKWRRSLVPVRSRLGGSQTLRPRAANAIEALEQRGAALSARERIRQARRGEDWPRSEIALTEGLAIEPDAEHLLCERSLVRLRQRKIALAIEDAAHVIEVNPDSAKAHTQWAVGLTHQRQYSEAAEQLVQSLELDPTHAASKELLGDVLSSIRRQRSYFKSPLHSNPGFEKVLEAGAASLNASRPSKPAPPVVTATSHCTIKAAWSYVADDGGDECFQFELQYAPIDPITHEVTHWRSAYRGIRKFGCQLSDLLHETEYCFRVQASNTVGDSMWSDYSAARTYALPEGHRTAINDLPDSWYLLKDDLDDAYKRIGGAETSMDSMWQATLHELKRNVAVLKQCFRVYTLAGKPDDNPVDVSMFQ